MLKATGGLKDEDGNLLPIIKKSKEEMKEEARLKRELKAKNAGKIKKIWAQGANNLFPENFEQMADMEMCSKFEVISEMLTELYKHLDEKIIIVSNTCETLDIFQRHCQMKSYPFCRLDGTTNIATRQVMVDKFNADNSLRS